MTTIYKEIAIDNSPEEVWDAVRDVGALHTRLVPGFVKDTRMEGDVRVVTFANGMVVREPILSIDDARRRLAWTAEGAKTTHYNAVVEVQAHGDGTRFVWTTDLLPSDQAPMVAAMQDHALAAIARALGKH
jgi:carbon monoxide dehydrogenase subunit G